MSKSHHETSSTEETRQRILDAAVTVFAENGYARATTRRIAEAAGVNEVTLFRHFESKKNLFMALFDKYGAPAVTAAIEAQLSGDYRQDLLRLGHYFMALMIERGDYVRLMMCEASHFPDLIEILVKNPRMMRQTLARYIQQQIDRGTLRPINAEAAAQAFWGMFFSYGLAHDFYFDQVDGGMSEEELVNHFVDIFYQGTIRQE